MALKPRLDTPDRALVWFALWFLLFVLLITLILIALSGVGFGHLELFTAGALGLGAIFNGVLLFRTRKGNQ